MQSWERGACNVVVWSTPLRATRKKIEIELLKEGLADLKVC